MLLRTTGYLPHQRHQLVRRRLVPNLVGSRSSALALRSGTFDRRHLAPFTETRKSWVHDAGG
jgi:hypothetical protein